MTRPMTRPMTSPAVVSIAPLVRLDDVSFRYPNGPLVLDSITLAVRPGDFTGLVGPSGSGKTTMLQVLLGMARPVSGAVQMHPGLRVGYVPQVEAINWNFPVTVFETVLMSSRTKRTWPWASTAERRRVSEVLERLGIADLSGRHIRQLSGGQQQRVFIARALFSSPDLLLLDEPTSGVDVRTRHEVLHLLGDLNAEGLAIVLSTHDLNGIAAHLPNVVCLHTQVMGMGTPLDVLTPEILERTYGAPMDVLIHAGMPLVVDRRHHGSLTGAS
jgi:ABC-type Mn2+/Zn2+ transport system ATPase subunit